MCHVALVTPVTPHMTLSRLYLQPLSPLYHGYRVEFGQHPGQRASGDSQYRAGDGQGKQPGREVEKVEPQSQRREHPELQIQQGEQVLIVAAAPHHLGQVGPWAERCRYDARHVRVDKGFTVLSPGILNALWFCEIGVETLAGI